MSSMERNKGWLMPIADSAEGFCRGAMQMGELPPAYGSWEEYFREYVAEDGFMLINGKVYEVHYEIESDKDSYSFADIVVKHGYIHFHTMHYNGGGSLEEVIQGALKCDK